MASPSETEPSSKWLQYATITLMAGVLIIVLVWAFFFKKTTCPAPQPCPDPPACPSSEVSTTSTKSCPVCPACPMSTLCPVNPACPVCPACPGCPSCPVCPACPTSAPVSPPVEGIDFRIVRFMSTADTSYGLIAKSSSSGAIDLTISRYASWSAWPYSVYNAFMITRTAAMQSDSFVPSGAARIIDVNISALMCCGTQLCTKGYVSTDGDRVVMGATPLVFRMCWTTSNQCFLACRPSGSAVWRYVSSAIPVNATDGPVALVNDPALATRYYASTTAYSKEGWGSSYTSSIFPV